MIRILLISMSLLFVSCVTMYKDARLRHSFCVNELFDKGATLEDANKACTDIFRRRFK